MQPHAIFPTRQLTADANMSTEKKISTDTTVTLPASPTYQSALEPAHPDTVHRYGQPDTTFTTKACTLTLFTSHFISQRFFRLSLWEQANSTSLSGFTSLCRHVTNPYTHFFTVRNGLQFKFLNIMVPIVEMMIESRLETREGGEI